MYWGVFTVIIVSPWPLKVLTNMHKFSIIFCAVLLIKIHCPEFNSPYINRKRKPPLTSDGFLFLMRHRGFELNYYFKNIEKKGVSATLFSSHSISHSNTYSKTSRTIFALLVFINHQICYIVELLDFLSRQYNYACLCMLLTCLLLS